jgi:hypothetical protein
VVGVSNLSCVSGRPDEGEQISLALAEEEKCSEDEIERATVANVAVRFVQAGLDSDKFFQVPRTVITIEIRNEDYTQAFEAANSGVKLPGELMKKGGQSHPTVEV